MLGLRCCNNEKGLVTVLCVWLLPLAAKKIVSTSVVISKLLNTFLCSWKTSSIFRQQKERLIFEEFGLKFEDRTTLFITKYSGDKDFSHALPRYWEIWGVAKSANSFKFRNTNLAQWMEMRGKTGVCDLACFLKLIFWEKLNWNVGLSEIKLECWLAHKGICFPFNQDVTLENWDGGTPWSL